MPTAESTPDEWADFTRRTLRHLPYEASLSMATGLVWAVAVEMAVRGGVPEDDAEAVATSVMTAFTRQNAEAVTAWKAAR